MAEFIKVDALGDACPLPVVKAKKAISELQGAGQVEVLVDNEIAVQNLTKMAQQKCYQYSAEKLESANTVCCSHWEKRQTPRQSKPLYAHRMPAPIRWLRLPLPRWAKAARSWARPCSRPLCLR